MTIAIQIVDGTFLTSFIKFVMFRLLWGLNILMLLNAISVLVKVATYTSFVDLNLASHGHALIKFIRWHLEIATHCGIIILLPRILIPTLLIFKFTISDVSLDILHRNGILRLNWPSWLSRLLLMLLWHLPNKFSLPHRLYIIFISSFCPFRNYLTLILLRLL